MACSWTRCSIILVVLISISSLKISVLAEDIVIPDGDITNLKPIFKSPELTESHKLWTLTEIISRFGSPEMREKYSKLKEKTKAENLPSGERIDGYTKTSAARAAIYADLALGFVENRAYGTLEDIRKRFEIDLLESSRLKNQRFLQDSRPQSPEEIYNGIAQQMKAFEDAAFICSRCQCLKDAKAAELDPIKGITKKGPAIENYPADLPADSPEDFEEPLFAQIKGVLSENSDAPALKYSKEVVGEFLKMFEGISDKKLGGAQLPWNTYSSGKFLNKAPGANECLNLNFDGNSSIPKPKMLDAPPRAPTFCFSENNRALLATLMLAEGVWDPKLLEIASAYSTDSGEKKKKFDEALSTSILRSMRGLSYGERISAVKFLQGEMPSVGNQAAEELKASLQMEAPVFLYLEEKSSAASFPESAAEFKSAIRILRQRAESADLDSIAAPASSEMQRLERLRQESFDSTAAKIISEGGAGNKLFAQLVEDASGVSDNLVLLRMAREPGLATPAQLKEIISILSKEFSAREKMIQALASSESSAALTQASKDGSLSLQTRQEAQAIIAELALKTNSEISEIDFDSVSKNMINRQVFERQVASSYLSAVSNQAPYLSKDFSERLNYAKEIAEGFLALNLPSEHAIKALSVLANELPSEREQNQIVEVVLSIATQALGRISQTDRSMRISSEGIPENDLSPLIRRLLEVSKQDNVSAVQRLQQIKSLLRDSFSNAPQSSISKITEGNK